MRSIAALSPEMRSRSDSISRFGSSGLPTLLPSSHRREPVFGCPPPRVQARSQGRRV